MREGDRDHVEGLEAHAEGYAGSQAIVDSRAKNEIVGIGEQAP